QWEINVGSTTDWPMEYGLVRYWLGQADKDSSTDLEFERHRVAPLVAGFPISAACPTGDLQAELDYNTVEKYANRALHAYATLLRALPSGEKTLSEQEASRQRLPCSKQMECITTQIDAIQAGVTQKDLDLKLDALSSMINFDRTVLRPA